jgi:uncharacterized protein YaeQ
MPDADRLYRGLKIAGRAAVYTHRDVRKLLAQLSTANISRMADIPVYALERSVVDDIAGLLERRSQMSLSITEREFYVEIRGQTFATAIVEHRIQI